jgi:hypothetical protein
VEKLTGLLGAITASLLLLVVENYFQILVRLKIHLMPLDGVDDGGLPREQLLGIVTAVCATHLAYFVLENVQSLPMGRMAALVQAEVATLECRF